MKDSKKANEDLLNSLHLMTAEKLAELLDRAEDDPELLLKVLQQCRGFLKDNEVTADITRSKPLRQIEGAVSVKELPFKVEEAEEA